MLNHAIQASFSDLLVFLYFLIVRLQKVIKDLDRYLKTPSSGPWAANRVAALDRSLGELNRMLEAKVPLVAF